MKKGGSTYIMTNKNNTVLYIGVTSDLIRRVSEHKVKTNPTSFTAKYNLDKLVYFENFQSIEEAINREKQLKGGSRLKKEILINSINPEWIDLFDELDRHFEGF
ncbi:GIY-YIG nuclease family protein [Algoriphagus marinus]|uniref:GIY-YIG nuclease family protein n=1 Tax=Algoriphagus marinus TaxID=1925762 RepID=UPI00094B8C84|nr:GIY-YIG nuclease family protein [Algoriphagus marinus]